MKLTTPNHDLVVRGLSFETVNALSGDAVCLGFDSLKVDETLEFNSIDELMERCDNKQCDEILAALNAQAQIERNEWYGEGLPRLRKFLHGG